MAFGSDAAAFVLAAFSNCETAPQCLQRTFFPSIAAVNSYFAPQSHCHIFAFISHQSFCLNPWFPALKVR
jgi:hypothetical protein